MTKLYGLHPVRYALTISGRVREIWLQTGRDDTRVKEILQLANRQSVAIHTTTKHRLTQLAGDERHQGVVADCHPIEEQTINNLEATLANHKGAPLMLCMENVQDPHNLGACLRSANAAACDAVIIPQQHSAKMTPAVHKVSAGGSLFTPVVCVSNLRKTLQQMKSYNVQCVGLAGEASESLYAVDFTQPTMIVMGAEGAGLSEAVRGQCDLLANIPMHGQVGSLNVSVATGIVLFEALRQRLTQNENTIMPKNRN